MADPSNTPGIGDAVHGLDAMRERMESFDHAAHSAGLSFGKLLAGIVTANRIQNFAERLLDHTKFGRLAKQAVGAMEGEYAAGARRAIAANEAAYAKRSASVTKTEYDAMQRLRAANLQNLANVTAVENSFRRAVGAAATLYTLFHSTLVAANGLNQNLIEANSSMEHRQALVRSTLEASAKTGIAFGQMTKSAAALVHYGLDERRSWQTNLELVSKLQAGVGLAEEHSARLAALVENQLGIGFEKVANTVARLVDYTALSANEAARLAEELTTVAATTGATNQNFDQVLAVLGEYGSAFKQLGGSSAEIGKLIDHLATLEGMPGAALLGFNNVEFASQAGATRQLFRSISEQAESATRGMNAYQRQISLQPMSALYNISWRTLNLMAKMEEQRRTLADSSVSLDDRFKQQTRAAGESLSRLWVELTTLLQRIAYPLISWVNTWAGRAADVIGGLNAVIANTDGLFESLSGVLATISTVVGVQLIPAFTRLLGLVRAIPPVLGASGAVGAVGATGGAGVLGGIALGPLAVIALTLSGIAYALYQYFKWKKIEQDEVKLREHVAKMQDTTEAHRAAAQRGAYSGDWSQIARGLFGIGGTDKGYIDQLAMDRRISRQEAAKIAVEELRPVLEGRLADVAQSASAQGVVDSALVKRYEDLIERLTTVIQKASEIDQRNMQNGFDKVNAVSDENVKRAILDRNLLKRSNPVRADVWQAPAY